MPKRDEKKFITEFIHLYSTFPCLWKKSDPYYHNATTKEACYMVLLDKYKEYYREGTIGMIKSKINSLRCAYKKEVNKVREAVEKTDTIHIPILWYYDLFAFLDNHITTPHTNYDSDEVDEQKDARHEKNEDEKSFEGRFLRKAKRQKICGTRVSTTNGRAMGTAAEREPTIHREPSRYEAFGRHIAQELANMSSEMVPFVQKVINEAIFNGQIKALNNTSRVLTHGEQQPQRSPIIAYDDRRYYDQLEVGKTSPLN